MNEDEILMQHLLQENKQLKNRVSELEHQIDKLQREIECIQKGHKQEMTQALKLLEYKDKTRDEFQIELEQKNIKLEETVKELRERNRQLQFMLGSLRLYQEIIEYEPSIIIAVNTEGNVILFNKAAADILGENFIKDPNKSIYSVDFSSLDPKIGLFIKEVLSSQKSMQRVVKDQTREIVTQAYMVKIGGEARGVVIRITVNQISQ